MSYWGAPPPTQPVYAGVPGYSGPAGYPPQHVVPQPSYYGAPAPNPSPFAPQYPPPAPMHMQPAPPPQQPQQQHGPPLHLLATDQNVFRQHYRSILQRLTFNSKPVIDELTVLAADHAARMSTVVAKVLEEHLMTVDPAHKLPVLYLLDSISKNIGGVYISHFGRFIERAFLQAFHEVDPQTKRKLEELLGTWKTGGPNRTPLFPDRVQHELELQLFGRQGRGGGVANEGLGMNDSAAFLAGLAQLPTMAAASDRQRALATIKRLLDFKRTQALVAPSDQQNSQHVAALTQLEVVVSSQVTSEQLIAIESQLAKIEAASSASLTAAAPVAPVASAAPVGIDFSAILGSLDAATLQAAMAGMGPAVAAQAPPDPDDKIEQKYKEKVLALTDLDFTMQSLSKKRKNVVGFLYYDLALQCGQCGVRFPDTIRGKGTYTVHLDRHFQHKRRLREATRNQSRAWLTVEDDWVEPPLQEDEVADAKPVVEEEKKPVSTVSAPTDPVKRGKPCPICKEGFKEEFSEKKEEFIWVDAIKVDDTIFHESCHTEALRSRLISKLEPGTPMSNTRSKSRENTPQLSTGVAAVKLEPNDDSVSVSTPNSLGKRKVASDVEDEAGPSTSREASTALLQLPHDQNEEPIAKRIKTEEIETVIPEQPTAPVTEAPIPAAAVVEEQPATAADDDDDLYEDAEADPFGS